MYKLKFITIMKTLGRFEHKCCSIKYLRKTSNEIFAKGKLYKVVVTPKHKNVWSEYEKEFDFSKDAEAYMLEVIKFWMN